MGADKIDGLGFFAFFPPELTRTHEIATIKGFSGRYKVSVFKSRAIFWRKPDDFKAKIRRF